MTCRRGHWKGTGEVPSSMLFVSFRTSDTCASEECKGIRIRKSSAVPWCVENFILTMNYTFKYNAQNWNWNICTGFFVLFVIYNLTDLFHQNKHLLNAMEMVLKSCKCQQHQLWTQHSNKATPELIDPVRKVGNISDTISISAWLYLFTRPPFLSVLKTCPGTLLHILHKWGALIIPIYIFQNGCSWSPFEKLRLLTFPIKKMNGKKGKGIAISE